MDPHGSGSETLILFLPTKKIETLVPTLFTLTTVAIENILSSTARYRTDKKAGIRIRVNFIRIQGLEKCESGPGSRVWKNADPDPGCEIFADPDQSVVILNNIVLREIK